MKILHISGAKGWGGNEQQMIDMIPELEKFNIENIVFGVGGSNLQEECSKIKVTFIPCKKDKLNNFSNYKYLKQLIKQIKPDLLHLHTSDSLTVFTLSDLFFKLNIPTVFSKKGMGNSSSILSKFKYNYKNLSAVICVSEKVKTEFSQILNLNNREKLVIIYDGVSVVRIKEPEYDLQDFLKISKSKIVIGNIANHVRAKDLSIMILAMNELINIMNNKNIHLIQIGGFNDKITLELKMLVEKLNLQNYVTLTGFLNNASSFISQFDVYVMSSEREGFPLTIYESFYKKTPVVSTKAGGIPEIIKDGENGFLVEVKDYEELAIKINELIYNQNLKEDFAQKAYDLFVNNYTTFHCAQKTFNLYKSLTK